MELILFYAFGGFAVLASLFVIGQRNPMYSVLLLIASFGGLAGLYVLLDAPFVAVTQIIVYAGAIMVLFLFVVMLLNVPREEGMLPGFGSTLPTRRIGAVLAVVLVAELGWAVQRMTPAGFDAASDTVERLRSVRAIGYALYTTHAFAFEATSVLILVAMVGAVVLARREPRS
jgi:NADH-quinone oxidoreductase subunit J